MQRSPDSKGEDGTPPKETTQPSDQDAADANKSKEEPKARKFHNGWTRQLENLVAEWADKASCYQWMHQKTEVRFGRYNMYFTIPVIIMSTLTGTANFATESIVGGTDAAKFVTFGIGAISLFAGIISTVANFLRYAQGSEAHRVAAISWGKFQRFISIELSLHPNERMDAMSFLKMGRIELDRLIEQSPPIPTQTVSEFMEAFKAKPDIIKPEIAGGIEHTRIFEDRESRLAKIAAEAAYIIQQKKGLMRQIVLEDIDKRIVQRARDERSEMEEELRREILTNAREAAREAALAVMRSPPTKSSAPPTGTSFPSARHEVFAVVQPGTVEKAKEKIAHRRRQSIIDGGVQRASVRLPIIPSLFAETAAAAAAVAAARQQPEDSEDHTGIRLEIVEDDGSVVVGK